MRQERGGGRALGNLRNGPMAERESTFGGDPEERVAMGGSLNGSSSCLYKP